VERCASCGLCLACRWCFLSAWRWRTWKCTSWWGWCGLSCGAFRKLPLAWGVQAVHTVGVVAADVAADEELHAVVRVVRFVAWDGAQVAAGVGRQLVLIVGVTAADVAAADEELDAVAGMSRFVVWHGAQVAAGVGRQLVLIVGVTAADVAAADEELDAVAEMARFVVWHGAQVAARVGRAAADYRRRGGGGRGAGRGGGEGGAVCPA